MAPRVPVITEAQVGSVGMPGYERRQIRPDNTIADSISALGQSAARLGGAAVRAGEQIAREEEKARREASAVLEANKMLEFTEGAQRQMLGDTTARSRIDDAFDGTDTSKGGFLATKGLAALEGSAGTLAAMEKDRKRLAETISDPEARTAFLLKSRDAMLVYGRQVETHAGREFVAAQGATADAWEEQAIASATSGVSDVGEFNVQMKSAEDSIRSVSRSPEEAGARVKKLHANTRAAYAASLVAQGRVEDAATFVEQNRALLGSRYVETQNLVHRGVEKLQAQRVVAGIMRSATAEDGFVDQEKARTAFSHLELEEQERAAPVMRRALANEAQRFGAMKGELRKSASRQFNQGGFTTIDEDVVGKLAHYDPDYLRRLRTEDELRQRRNRARAGGARTSRAELQNDKLYITRFKALGTRGMAEADVDDFAMGHGLTELGVAELQRLKTYAGEKAQGAEGRGQQDMQSEVERQYRALPKSEKKKLAENEDDIAAMRSAAFDAYTDFLEEKKRPPTAEERSAMAGELLRKVNIESPRTVFGLSLGTKSEERRGFEVRGKAPGTVRVRFPNGQEFSVPAEKLDAAQKKGGVVIDG